MMIYHPDAYLGKRYAPGGRGPLVYDCYGLVQALYRDNGLGLPDGPALTAPDEIAPLFSCGLERFFAPVEEPSPLDVLAFAIHPRFVSHIGVVLPETRFFLHVAEGGSVVAERWGAPPWKARLRGVYRWKG